MVDQFSPEKRSEIMSRVKNKNTSIELNLRKELWSRGYRYRLYTNLPGTPDIVFPKIKIVIFVDGCFWHNCPICQPKMPSTNKEYWRNKIDRNVERAKKADKELENMGWDIIHIWGHQINKDLEKTVDSLISYIKQKR